MREPLLILSCSDTKLPNQEGQMLSAYERYDGPAYRILRKAGYPTVAKGPHPRVRILSAKYGLLSSFAPVPDYNQRMDEERAAELGELDDAKVIQELFLRHRSMRRSFDHFPASEIFVFGGALYKRVVRRWEERGLLTDIDGVPIPVAYSSGGIGVQLGQLKRFIYARKEVQNCPSAA